MPLQTLVPKESWAWVANGPLPETPRWNHHESVMANTITKWVEVFPVPDMLAVTIVWEVMCQFNTPCSFHSDPGCTFKSQVMEEVSKLQGVTKTHTIPYHPQSDGQVEWFNHTLGNRLTAVIGKDQWDCDLQLPYLTAA